MTIARSALACSLELAWAWIYGIRRGGTVSATWYDFLSSPHPYNYDSKTTLMSITHRRFTTWTFASLLSLSYASRASAFTFWFTNPPTQCANTTVQWGGGRPPFTLLLVPVGHLSPETRIIHEFTITSGFSTSFILDYPAQSQFVAVLNDASGVGAGGTSRVLTVAPSDTTSCLNTQQVAPKFFFHLSTPDIAQCGTVDITWDSNAQPPVEILGLIPGGQSFEIANVTDGGTQVQWQADVRQGSGVVLVAGDSDGLGTGGSTDILPVGPGDSSCVDGNTPGTTPGVPAGSVSTAAPGGGQTGGGDGSGGSNPTPTDSAGNPVPTGGEGSGGQATGTAGSGQPGQTGGSGDGNGGGGNGNGNGNGNGGNGGGGGDGGGGGGNGSPTFPGSGGGTVTGAPEDSGGHHSNLGLILGLVFGVLGLIALALGGILLYRKHKRRRAAAYRNLDLAQAASGAPPSISSFPTAWRSWRNRSTPGATPGSRRWFSFNWATRLRGGAPSSGGASTETLPSMFQTDPFIMPAQPRSVPVPVRSTTLLQDERDEPFVPPSLSAYYDSTLAPTSQRRLDIPSTMSRTSDSGEDPSLRAFLESLPYSRDANIIDDEVMGLIAAGNQPRSDQRGQPPSSYTYNALAPPLSRQSTVSQTHDSTESSAIASAGHSEKQALLERNYQPSQTAVPPILPPSSTPPPLHQPSYPARPTALRTPSGLHIHTILVPQSPMSSDTGSGNRMPPPAPLVSPTRVTRDSEDFSPEPDEASPNPFGEEVEEIPPSYSSVRAVSMRARRGEIPVMREEDDNGARVRRGRPTALPTRILNDADLSPVPSEPPSPGAVSLSRSNALTLGRPASRTGQRRSTGGRSRSGTLSSLGHGHSASDGSHHTTTTRSSASRSHTYSGSHGSSQMSRGQSSGANASVGHDGHVQ